MEWQKGFGHFTANDVKASFDRLRRPKRSRRSLAASSMLQEVQVVDDYTVKFILSEPYAAFPQLLTDYRAGPIVNVKAVQQFGKDYDWNPVGTGPYQFESGVPKQEAIDHRQRQVFRRPAAHQDASSRAPFPTINAQVVGLENGQYDMLLHGAGRPGRRESLDRQRLRASMFSRNLPEVLLMNITVKPFDDLKVRQAIAYAVDRQQFIDLA